MVRLWCLFVSRLQSLARFWCSFVPKKTSNNAAMPQGPFVIDQHNECDQALWHHSNVCHLFGDKHQNLKRLMWSVSLHANNRFEFLWSKHQNLETKAPHSALFHTCKNSNEFPNRFWDNFKLLHLKCCSNSTMNMGEMCHKKSRENKRPNMVKNRNNCPIWTIERQWFEWPIL